MTTFERQEILERHLGTAELLDQIVKALDHDTLEDILIYIGRMNDIDLVAPGWEKED